MKNTGEADQILFFTAGYLIFARQIVCSICISKSTAMQPLPKECRTGWKTLYTFFLLSAN
jgi:hypothetical protein